MFMHVPDSIKKNSRQKIRNCNCFGKNRTFGYLVTLFIVNETNIFLLL